MKSIKCNYISCKNEAIGYFVGQSFGLWLCKEHKAGRKKTDIKDARDNKKYEHLHNIEI